MHAFMATVVGCGWEVKGEGAGHGKLGGQRLTNGLVGQERDFLHECPPTHMAIPHAEITVHVLCAWGQRRLERLPSGRLG